MKNLQITLAVLFALYANPLQAQISGIFEGTELACLSSTDTYTFWWSDTARVTNETITYSIKTRSGGSINSSDVVKSDSNGILTLVIDKNRFDIMIKMTVKVGNDTKVFSKKLQVGLGDPLDSDMIKVINGTLRCRDNSWITLSVDKMNVYGVDFLWTFPTGWTQVDGEKDNYIKVRPDGIHLGAVTCQMKVYGDQFCEGNEAGNYLGPIVPIEFNSFSLPPEINKITPTGQSSTLTYNSTTPITFIVSPKSGATYTWSLPCGWKRPNGQTGSFTTTTSYVDITPTGYTGPGEQVKVRANMDCAGTPQYTNYVTWGFVWGGGQASTISGTSILCSSNRTYTINNPAGTTVSWSVSPTSLFAVDTGTGSSFTTRATNSFVRGAGTISATVSGTCGSVPIPPKPIWVGKPQTPAILFPYTVMGQNSSFTIDAVSMGAATYNWHIAGGQLISGQGTSTIFVRTNSSCPVDFSIRVTASNSCGTSPVSSKTIPFNCNGLPIPIQIIINPNPANNEITVNFSGLFANKAKGKGEVLLYNKKKEVVFRIQTNKQTLVIPTRSLPDGHYYLNAVYLDKTFQKHIIIKH